MSNESVEVSASRQSLEFARSGNRGEVRIVSLVSVSRFECVVLPPNNSFSGAIVPRAVQKGRRRRLISVEVHRVELLQPPKPSQRNLNAGTTTVSSNAYEECVVRIWVPLAAARDRGSNSRRLKRNGSGRKVDHDDDDDDDDVDHSEEDSSTMLAPEFLDPSLSSPFVYPDSNPQQAIAAAADTSVWKVKYRFPLQQITLQPPMQRNAARHLTVGIELVLGIKKERRDIVFDNKEEAERFQKVLRNEIALEDERAQAKTKVALGEDVVKLDEAITFLVEVVSGWDLPAADFTSSDPFVKCLLNGKEVHQTDYIRKTLDPVWTVATGSLFLLTASPQELFSGDGLFCMVYDFDKVGANDKLGSFVIPPMVLYRANGERLEFKLCAPPGQKGEVPGYLAVRIRRATDYDKDFLQLQQANKARGLGSPKVKLDPNPHHEIMGGKGNIASLLARRSRKVGKNDTEYKIRPGPDPKRKEETTWLTKDQIDAECKRESTRWVDAGSGSLGRVFVEILHCDGLPNLDVGGFAGNKSDAFVSLVYEDATVQTDVIDDCLSPRWMPWMRRAFIFHMLHSSSELFLGVFDCDEGINPADDHDLIGRVSVDLTNLRKNTLYTLQYNIYTTARMSSRKKKGTITLRIRIEIDDERKMLLSSMEPPPKLHVNVKTRREFRLVRYTCTGKYNMEKYNMKVIDSYIEELLALQHAMFYVQDSVKAVLLWKGTLPVTIPIVDRDVLFPIHSLSAFLLSILLVERPQLIPSIFFACIAWLMLASQEYRRSLPDVWFRCKTFLELLEVLIIGESTVPPDSIKENHNAEATKIYAVRWEKRIKAAEAAAEKSYKEQLEALQAYEREMEEIGETADMDAGNQGSGAIALDPFHTILFPVQQNLAVICRYVRHVKHVISWQECYIAFWITAGSIVLSLICVFIPWVFIIKWSARIVVWGCLGPWMKLVDIYYVGRMTPMTDEELKKKKYLEREQRNNRTKIAVSEARKKREDTIKLKDMKKIMFGKFITRVPVLKEDRYRDIPTPASHAEPYQPQPTSIAILAMKDAGYHRLRMPGQHLVGDMIPKVEAAHFTDAPVGQPTSYMALVDKNLPGGSIVTTGADSTVVACMKLGSLVAAAAFITWFGVPILSVITQRALLYTQ